MISIGINSGITLYGKKLRDGGTCIITDQGIISAISEERITRKKSDGGYKNSLEVLMGNYNINFSDVDVITYSSCCEYSPSIIRQIKGYDQPIKIQSHHLSHAYSAYYTSDFDEAIVIVMDAGGDLLENSDSPRKWWKTSREQNSYFIARNGNINLLDCDFHKPFDVGFGEAFRAFTKYLGWKTEYTGKLMALAGLVASNPYSSNVDLFYFNEGHLNSRLRSYPKQPRRMINSFSKEYELSFPMPNSKSFIEEYAELANFMQSQYEKYLFIIIENLYKKTKIKNLCISGGVGLNCVANGKIAENTSISKVYIPPACGDQGQCLGNAIYGMSYLKKSSYNLVLNSAFLGPEIYYDKKSIKILFQDQEKFTTIEKNVYNQIAILLHKGKIGAVHVGRSEFGPRALGNRSILAEPFTLATKLRLNNIKKRESFNPFAICVPLEYSNKYFYSNNNSPFMQFAFKVRSKYISKLQGIVHNDGSCRIQTINKANNSHVYSIIEEFNKLTGFPIIINTSLNTKDEPLCETIEESVHCFQIMNLDFILINDILVVRK